MSLKNCEVIVQLVIIGIETNTVNKRTTCAHFLNFRNQLCLLETLGTNSSLEANFRD